MGAASDRLVVVRVELGVLFSKNRVVLLFLGDDHVPNDVDEGNSQCATNAGQDGLHFFKSLSG